MDSQKVYLYLLAAVYTTSIVHVYGRPASINTPKAVISPAAEYRLNRRGQLLLPATATYRPRATRQLSTKDIKVTSTVGEITDSDLVGLHNNHFNINSDINQNSDSDLNSNKNNNLADSLLSKMYNEIITTRLHSLLRGVEHFSHSPTVNTDIFLPAALAATAAESGQRKMSTDNEEVVYLQAAVTEMPLEELKNLPGLKYFLLFFLKNTQNFKFI